MAYSCNVYKDRTILIALLFLGMGLDVLLSFTNALPEEMRTINRQNPKSSLTISMNAAIAESSVATVGAEAGGAM